jgi:hypothetical protein
MLLKFDRRTKAETLKNDSLVACRSIMLEVASHTPTLLTVVANGPQQFRNYVLSQTRGLAIDADIADRMFAFFRQKVRHEFGGQQAGAVLDKLEVKSPPTQREIDESWEVDSSSSEEGRRFFYGVDGHPEELIKRIH